MFDGKKVSGRWFTLLHAARDHGVRFRLNSGRRSIAEQWRLWWASKRGGPLAAYPSPTAPHIRVGRPDHALDVQQDDDGTSAAGGRERLQEWLRRRGLQTSLTVAGENWHIEADSLRRLILISWRFDSLAKHRRRLASRRRKREKARTPGAWRRYDRLVNESLDSIKLRKQQLHL